MTTAARNHRIARAVTILAAVMITGAPRSGMADVTADNRLVTFPLYCQTCVPVQEWMSDPDGIWRAVIVFDCVPAADFSFQLCIGGFGSWVETQNGWEYHSSCWVSIPCWTLECALQLVGLRPALLTADAG